MKLSSLFHHNDSNDDPEHEHDADVEMKGGQTTDKLKDEKVSQKKKRANHEYLATEHLLSIEELGVMYQTSLNIEDIPKSMGLSEAQAAQKLITDGRNRLSPPKTTPEWIKFLKHFTNIFMLLLTAAGVLSCVAYAIDRSQPINLYLGIILFVVVLCTCTMSYFQERVSGNVMGTFSKMLPQKCTIIRDGIEREIPAEELVSGDLVKFGIGEKIPADMRILVSKQAKVENSSITGESVPITLTVEKTGERPTESRNLVYNSSMCLNGEAYGLVIRTGDRTMIGQIAQLAGVQKNKLTTLQIEVRHFVRFIGVLAFVMAIILFTIGMARGQPFVETFVNGFIVVIVANIPQGLPATVTSVIGIAAKKMAKKNVFVKRLDCVETLGSTSLVASDKTGTLTQNLMSVVSFWYNEEYLHIDTGFDSILMVDLIDDKDFQPLMHCASLCNRAKYKEVEKPKNPRSVTSGTVDLDPDHEYRPGPKDLPEDSIRLTQAEVEPQPKKEREIVGDASDAAIFRFLNTLGVVEKIRRNFPRIFEIPFNSTNKYSVCISNNPLIDPQASQIVPRHTLYMKGAPEIILERCSHFMTKGQVYPMNEQFTTSVKTALRRSGMSGQRVLAFAETHLLNPDEGVEYTEEKGNYPLKDLTFLGLVALVDPPRPSVPKAVLTLKEASIKVIMVTGDHPVTAEAIARQVNIIKDGKTAAEIAAIRGVSHSEVSIYDPEVQAVVMNGMELEDLSDEQWEKILRKKEVVFSRTTPAQKLEIVERNQALGHVVAVTGDGVNDSPALKAADVGVAMGKMGSDVSREAADLILMNDDFGSIVDGVKMGRTIFDNLKKTIAYTLTHLVPEMIPVLCTLTFSIPLGLNSIQILFIDLGTELFPAISLAYEPPEPGIMKRPPRKVKTDRLVSAKLLLYVYLQAGIIQSIACLVAYFLVFNSYGIPPHALPLTSEHFWREGAEDFVVGDKTYDAAQQLLILRAAQTAWFITLVTSQFYHIWFVKMRKVSIFAKFPTNPMLLFGVIIEICILVILVYVPFMRVLVETYDVPGYIWAVSLIFGVLVGIRSEFVIWHSRKFPKGFVKRKIAW